MAGASTGVVVGSSTGVVVGAGVLGSISLACEQRVEIQVVHKVSVGRDQVGKTGGEMLRLGV